jgi:hypothetical protein
MVVAVVVAEVDGVPVAVAVFVAFWPTVFRIGDPPE